jgi:hypothetical protein
MQVDCPSFFCLRSRWRSDCPAPAGEKEQKEGCGSFAFLDEPGEPTVQAFIRVTAAQLFPELGVADGQEIQTVQSALQSE